MDIENYSDYTWEAFQAARKRALSRIQVSRELTRMSHALAMTEPHGARAADAGRTGATFADDGAAFPTSDKETTRYTVAAREFVAAAGGCTVPDLAEHLGVSLREAEDLVVALVGEDRRECAVDRGQHGPWGPL